MPFISYRASYHLHATKPYLSIIIHIFTSVFRLFKTLIAMPSVYSKIVTTCSQFWSSCIYDDSMMKSGIVTTSFEADLRYSNTAVTLIEQLLTVMYGTYFSSIELSLLNCIKGMIQLLGIGIFRNGNPW